MNPAPGPSKTVVIADDTAFVRDRFRSALEQAGHRAITVKSAVRKSESISQPNNHVPKPVMAKMIATSWIIARMAHTP